MKERIRRALHPAHLFALPYVLTLVVFGIGPALYALVISFASFRSGTPQLFAAGLDNYVRAYTDFRFLPSFWRIGQFLAISVPLGVVGVMAISLLVHARHDRLGAGMRTLYFIPGAVAGPILALLAIFMFDPNISPFAPLLQALGLRSMGQIASGDRLPFVFSVMFFFAGAGGWIAIFYGAFNGISSEITEAATMDGCGPIRMGWSIKLPLVRPYIIYMFILTFAGNVQLFVEPQLLARAPGAAIGKYWSPNQLSYAFAFELGDFGGAAAISLVMLAIGLVAAILVIKTTSFFRTDATDE
ncbi:MAG: sugar ABC transporter permease [Chloroflexi bacterium]|nr:sugar ABC transporter permease [Chloroflexota bacterium]